MKSTTTPAVKKVLTIDFLRRHWFDLAGVGVILVATYLALAWQELSIYQRIMWVSLIALFLHELEEYRVVGTFPGMLNKVLFKSDRPDRYPLNMNTALVVNVPIAWSIYVLAALVGERAVWLGMASILISVGNIIGHVFLFNIIGKSLFNAGMFTSVVLFIPVSTYFFYYISASGLAKPIDYLIGLPLGVIFAFLGIYMTVQWMKNKDTPYPFPSRCLLPEDRD